MKSGTGRPPPGGPVCLAPRDADLSGVSVVMLRPSQAMPDHTAALRLANGERKQRLGEAMLLSWYDRDRDF